MAAISIILLLLAIHQTIRVEVSLVTVGVRVTDSRGRDVQGLKAEDFTILEDGVRREVAFFSGETQPMTLGILLDSSGSMEYNRKIDRAKEAARALVGGALAGSEFFYIDFDERVTPASDFTTDRLKIESAIEQTSAEGGTSLYDALLQGLTMTDRARLPLQALVVISDGADQHSKSNLEEILDIVRKSEIQIYTIGYFSPEEERLFRTPGTQLSLTNGVAVDNPRIALEKIARESGAASFFPASDKELAEAIVKINEDLKTQYTIAFYPASLDRNRYHSLKVTVPGNRYNVRARPGFGLQ